MRRQNPGNYCPGLGASLPCALNTWSEAGVNPGPCIACATHSFAMSDVAMRVPDMCQCVAGAEGRGDRNCSLCAAGSFQPCDLSQKREHTEGHTAACDAVLAGLDNRSSAGVIQQLAARAASCVQPIFTTT